MLRKLNIIATLKHTSQYNFINTLTHQIFSKKRSFNDIVFRKKMSFLCFTGVQRNDEIRLINVNLHKIT